MPNEEIDSPDIFGAALRRTREARGTSLSVLGVTVHYSKGHLSKIENGAVRANLRLAQACDLALGADGRLIAVFLADSTRPVLAADAAEPDIPFDVPAAPSRFTGRAKDIARVLESVLGTVTPGRAPTALIYGLPGIGKTALATHVAHTLRAQYPGGCLFVDFGARPAVDSAPCIHVLLLRRLGVAADAIPDDPGEARALYLSIVYRRPVLVVLDDITAAAQVSALVPASPACGVIATSRRRLDALDDCHPIRLDPLGIGDATALFRAVADLADTGSEPDLARIAVACGGVPLAIRVAATKFRESGRSAAELASRLESAKTAWDELDDGERSVERTLASGVRSLPVSGQRTLAMLAAHPAATADRHAVGWLRDASPQTVAGDFADLQRHDLITIARDGRASAQGLVRTFAENLLSQVDGQARGAALRRLITGYAKSAAAAEGAITPLRFLPPESGTGAAVAAIRFAEPSQAMAWCDATADLVPQLCSLAYELGMDDDCWRLAYAFRGHFFTVKALRPWIASHRVAVRAAERSRDSWAQAVTRNNLGMALIEQGDSSAAERQYQRAMEILSAIGDDRGMTATRGHLAWASHAAGRYDAAIRLSGQAISEHRQRGDARSIAIMSRTAALAYAKLGEHRAALKCLAECEEILSGIYLPLDKAMMFNCLGEVHYAVGDWGAADKFHHLAAERSAVCRGLGEEARAISGLAACAKATGAHARAEVLQERAAGLRAQQSLAGEHLLNLPYVYARNLPGPLRGQPGLNLGRASRDRPREPPCGFLSIDTAASVGRGQGPHRRYRAGRVPGRAPGSAVDLRARREFPFGA